jgi:hypothetical protein
MSQRVARRSAEPVRAPSPSWRLAARCPRRPRSPPVSRIACCASFPEPLPAARPGAAGVDDTRSNRSGAQRPRRSAAADRFDAGRGMPQLLSGGRDGAGGPACTNRPGGGLKRARAPEPRRRGARPRRAGPSPGSSLRGAPSVRQLLRGVARSSRPSSEKSRRRPCGTPARAGRRPRPRAARQGSCPRGRRSCRRRRRGSSRGI